MAATPSTSSKRRKVDSECRGFNPVWREKYLFAEHYGKADVLTWFFPAWPATSLSGTHLARDPKKFADPWSSGCGCKKVYRFPHITYPYSCICSFLQQHPYFLFFFLFMFLVLVPVHFYNIFKKNFSQYKQT